MSDIVQRLRDSATQARALDRSELLNEAADEIVKIRREVADLRGGSKPVAWVVMDGKDAMEFCTDEEEAKGAAKYYGGRIVPLYRKPTDADREAVEQAVPKGKPAEVSFTLTDAEREALSWFTGGRGPVCPQYMATIRGLLERTK